MRDEVALRSQRAMIDAETFRREIIAVLELAASRGKQLEYARRVPIELAFTQAERSGLQRYAHIHELSLSSIDTTLSEFQAFAASEVLAQAAASTLEALKQRKS